MVWRFPDPYPTYADGYAAADQISQQMNQMNPAGGAGMFGPGQDPHKMFLAEAENIEVAAGQHDWVLNGVERRLLSVI